MRTNGLSLSALAVMGCLVAAAMPAGAKESSNAAPVAAGSYTVAGPEKKNGTEIYTINSGYQKGPCNLFVLLPDNYDKSKRYKVLYVLPCFTGGSPGLDEVRKLNLANKHNFIGVYPGYSAYPSPNGPWYGDHPTDPLIRCDSYLVEVIVPFVDKTYPTIAKPEGRIVIGFSKSGVGALQVFLRHIDVFGRMGAWDAPLLGGSEHPEYYGPRENFDKEFSAANLLTRRLDLLKGKPARMAIAGPGPKGSMTGSSGAHELLDKLGIAHYSNLSLGGTHAWNSGWLGPLVDVLMADDMTKAPAGGAAQK